MAGRLPDSKRALSSMGTIGSIVIVLIIIALLLFTLSDVFDKAEKGTDCEAIGGVWSEDCNKDFLMQAVAFGEKDDKICCLKNIGLSESEEEQFEKWYEQQAQSSGSAQSGSQQARPLTSDQFSETQEDIYMMFNNEGWQGSMTLSEASNPDNHITIDPDDKNTFAAVNNDQDIERCTMGIYPAEPFIGEEFRRDGNTPVSGFQVQHQPCNIRTGMQFIGILTKEGYYKWDVELFDEKGERTGSATRIIHVKEGISSPSGEGIKQKILPEIRIVAENNFRKCFVSARVMNQSLETGKYFGTTTPSIIKGYFLTDKEIKQAAEEGKNICPRDRSTYNEPVDFANGWDDIIVDFNERSDLHTACFYFKESETRTTTGADELVTLNQDSCDTIEVIDYKLFEEIFYECSYDCEMYKNQQVSCNDRESRNDRCRLSLDCEWEQGLFKKNTCTNCHEDFSFCKDYDNEEACTSNQCIIDHSCYWESGFPKGECKDCDETPSCNDYNSSKACESNPCGVAGGEEGICSWEDGECKLDLSASGGDSMKTCDEMNRGECEGAQGCLWDAAFFGGECQDCAERGIDDCDSYPDKNACKQDYCNIECQWEGNGLFSSGECNPDGFCESDDDCNEGEICHQGKNRCKKPNEEIDTDQFNDQDPDEDVATENCVEHGCDFSTERKCLSEGGKDCKGVLGCYWIANVGGLSGSEYCQSCSSITSCSDYKYMYPCDTNECSNVNDNCFWNPDENTASGNYCQSCNDIMMCNDYISESACNRDACSIEYDCMWNPDSPENIYGDGCVNCARMTCHDYTTQSLCEENSCGLNGDLGCGWSQDGCEQVISDSIPPDSDSANV
ncbi:MAG: hypothetical protein ACQESE_01150 [Nanobdellota archaeon]